mmetsp:Transcript_32412/g.39441  ORF Transcript_32412/g.39441 Transcript_32412/m.39441 type:complete len:91 (-) Transcript_32412:102-374(-)
MGGKPSSLYQSSCNTTHAIPLLNLTIVGVVCGLTSSAEQTKSPSFSRSSSSTTTTSSPCATAEILCLTLFLPTQYLFLLLSHQWSDHCEH